MARGAAASTVAALPVASLPPARSSQQMQPLAEVGVPIAPAILDEHRWGRGARMLRTE